MRQIIMVDEKTRIRHMDEMNWTLETLRKVTSKDGAERQEWVQANGRGYGPFAGKPDSPVFTKWLIEHAPELEDFNGTMAEHAKAVDKVGRRIAKSIADLNKEVA